MATNVEGKIRRSRLFDANWMRNDRPVKISLFVEWNSIGLRIAFAVGCTCLKLIASRRRIPIDVPADPGLRDVWFSQTSVLPRFAAIEADIDLYNVALARPRTSA